MTAQLRAARTTDAGKLGAIMQDFIDKAPWMPVLHSKAETISFCGTMIDRGWVTVAENFGRVIGFLALDGNEVAALYIARDVQGLGIGAVLLGHAKTHCEQLTLWTFQANTGAVRFYQSHGFCEVTRSNGGLNDEKLPDIQFLWMQKESA